MTKEITDSNYEETISTDKLVLIDFWADWCGPCKVIGPIIDEISNEYEDKMIVGKLNVDDNPEVTAKLGIRNIPTILFFKNGEIVDKSVGAATKNMIIEKIENLNE